MPGPIVVTVQVDTREAEKRLRLLRFCLWLNGLWPRLWRWLARHVPFLRDEIFRLQRERDEARALASELHKRFWVVLALMHIKKLGGNN